jgi:catechol 2,3-dioxygenase-like lactoylglutathione lyase family enzyme
MQINSFYPVIMTKKVAETARFYQDHLNFELTFEADWYVSLKQPVAPFYELAILDYEHETVPAAFRQATQGLILNFEVADVDVEYDRLIKQSGLPVHFDITTMDFGQRHFITADPSGVMLDVIKVIPTTDPTAAAQYTDLAN